MKYYKFHQNNSGGSFDINDKRGIGPSVWIEADSATQANSRAESLGIYFNGCDDDTDCSCCGDRWYSIYADDDGEDSVEITKDYDFHWHDTVYVHHIDGRIERIKK